MMPPEGEVRLISAISPHSLRIKAVASASAKPRGCSRLLCEIFDFNVAIGKAVRRPVHLGTRFRADLG